MPWLTNKETGGHFNTDWLEDEKTKNKQIAENKKQADERNNVLTKDEEDALSYWKGGENGRGYVKIRNAALGKVDDPKIKKLAEDFKSAVSKAPSAEGQTLVRVSGDWRIPGKGKPEVGMEFSLRQFESFSKAPEKDYDRLVEHLGQHDNEEIVFRIKGTSNFKDISSYSKNTGGTGIEKEVLAVSSSNYRITKITPIKEEGTWLNPEGKQKYIMVDIEESKKRN